MESVYCWFCLIENKNKPIPLPTEGRLRDAQAEQAREAKRLGRGAPKEAAHETRGQANREDLTVLSRDRSIEEQSWL